MASFPNMILTNAGKNMIAQAQLGQELVFTKGKYGDGIVAGDQQSYTDLISPKLNLPIQNMESTNVGQATITVLINREGLAAGFFGRELGLFAKIGDAGTEQLFCYTNAGSKADYIPSGTDTTIPYDEFIDITTIIGNSANVSVVIDQTKVYITLERLNKTITEHNTNESAHSDMVGASSTVAGKRGFVPAPAKGSGNRYLKADGTWEEINEMTGATATAAGKRGMVPAPAIGDNKAFLAGDGTYHKIATQAEAEAGTNDDAVMTPLKVKQSVAKKLQIGGTESINNGGMFIETTATETEATLWGKFKTKVGGVLKEIKIKTSQIIDFNEGVLAAIAAKGLSSLGVVYSMQANGYICFGPLFGGLILQWGTTPVGSTVDVVFPIVFSETFIMQVNPAKDFGTNSQYTGVAIFSLSPTTPVDISNTGAKVYFRGTSGGAAPSSSYGYWLAVGKSIS